MKVLHQIQGKIFRIRIDGDDDWLYDHYTRWYAQLFDLNISNFYPNPAKDNLNIVSYAELINSVEVYNLSGQKVLSKKVNATTTRINTNSLSKGVYIVDIKSKVSSVKKKVIIE